MLELTDKLLADLGSHLTPNLMCLFVGHQRGSIGTISYSRAEDGDAAPISRQTVSCFRCGKTWTEEALLTQGDVARFLHRIRRKGEKERGSKPSPKLDFLSPPRG